MTKLIIIESPYAGEIERNMIYLGRAIKDTLSRNESPIASHGLFPQFYNDANPFERNTCMYAGWAWMRAADYIVVYTDYGISEGMRLGIEEAESCRCTIVYRQIGANP